MPHQRVMITAAASGIGRCIARAFADEGAKVHVCDVDEEALGAFRRGESRDRRHPCERPQRRRDRSLVRRRARRSRRPRCARQQCRHQGPDRACRRHRLRRLARMPRGLPRFAFPVRPARRAGDEGPKARAPSSTSPRRPACSASACARPMRRPNGRSIGFTKSLAIELGPHNVRVQLHLPRRGRGDRIDRVIAAEAEQRGVASESGPRGISPGPVDQALRRARGDRRSVPVPCLARRQDDFRPGHRPSMATPKPITHRDADAHGFRPDRRTADDRQDHARFRRERALSA